MRAVHIITGRGVPLQRSDVDTDQIIPAEWLKRVERTGFEKGLFATWRDDRNFVLNDERYAGASILVDAVIAPSFSDIFRNNCTKNGLVPVVVPEAVVHAIWAAIEADHLVEITIDVERLTVEVPAAGITASFPMDPQTQHRYLNGLDDVGITLGHADDITAFEAARPAWLP